MVEYKKTSYSEGFGIFNRIHKENLDGVNNNVLIVTKEILRTMRKNSQS